MWKEYLTPLTLADTLRLLNERGGRARLLAGATDLMLELERGVRQDVTTIIDITRLPDLDRIDMDDEKRIHIGPLVTHNAAAASPLLREKAFPLVSACWQVGAPQIRNRATIAGNLVTASPANDTITPLAALGAELTLISLRGRRSVPLLDFYTGVRRTILQPDEMLVDISFPAMDEQQRGTFLKLGLRRAQAISLVNVAVILHLDRSPVGGNPVPLVRSAVITLGAVAPVIVHARPAEDFLQGKHLTGEAIAQAGELAAQAARPIDDLRGSAAYRRAMVRTLTSRALHQLSATAWRTIVPEKPILLESKAREEPPASPPPSSQGGILSTHVNGRQFTFPAGSSKSLLRLLREDFGLTGTKEGCAEGECGACTVFMDGKAVMACLVPAPRAEGAEITTIEGLANGDHLHPVQEAFISEGAVQCGYCTPGFLMSSALLLEERPHPSRDEITQALTGNLCRCTGYYKIIQAVERAAMRKD